MIEKMGLKVLDLRDENLFVVSAFDLESILQSAQVVYRSKDGLWTHEDYDDDTHKGLLIGVEAIKKKTQAEAALELLQEMLDDCLPMQGSEHDFAIEAKRILKMKDEV